jgi:hypothetical protein
MSSFYNPAIPHDLNSDLISSRNQLYQLQQQPAQPSTSHPSANYTTDALHPLPDAITRSNRRHPSRGLKRNQNQYEEDDDEDQEEQHDGLEEEDADVGDTEFILGITPASTRTIKIQRKDKDHEIPQTSENGRGVTAATAEDQEVEQETVQGFGQALYVNAKQYSRILKRRITRVKFDEIGRLSLQKKVSLLSADVSCHPPCNTALSDLISLL